MPGGTKRANEEVPSYPDPGWAAGAGSCGVRSKRGHIRCGLSGVPFILETADWRPEVGAGRRGGRGALLRSPHHPLYSPALSCLEPESGDLGMRWGRARSGGGSRSWEPGLGLERAGRGSQCLPPGSLCVSVFTSAPPQAPNSSSPSSMSPDPVLHPRASRLPLGTRGVQRPPAGPARRQGSGREGGVRGRAQARESGAWGTLRGPGKGGKREVCAEFRRGPPRGGGRRGALPGAADEGTPERPGTSLGGSPGGRVWRRRRW